VVYPLLYLGMYAGDAEIHLVYGANAAAGRFFEFNPGESSPGVTSPGFMLMIAALFRWLPAEAVPVAVKSINLLAWYGLCFVVFRLARRLGLQGGWEWAAVGVAGLIPGSAYNATVGMENGLFALGVLVWIERALATGWFDMGSDRTGRGSWKSEAWLGAAIGLTVWLRPEGFVVGGLALGHRIVRSARHGVPTAFLIPFVAVSAGLVAFHYAHTGYLLPASGLARIVAGSENAFWIGPVAINGRVLTRLAVYFPITVLWLAGMVMVLKKPGGLSGAQTATEFFCLLTGTCFVLYSTVFGAAHLARYLIFVMPLFVLVASLGARRVWEWPGSVRILRFRLTGPMVVLVLAAALGLVFAAESRARLALGFDDELFRIRRAPAERGSVSDALYRALGSPAELPVVIAYREIQVRYWLDDRFVIRALDGRTDPVTLEFASGGRIDHLKYIKARRIQFLAEVPLRSGDSGEWSLAELDTLGPSERQTHEGLVFTRLPGSQVIRVEVVR
jgi:hypothetical protein